MKIKQEDETFDLRMLDELSEAEEKERTMKSMRKRRLHDSESEDKKRKN